MEPQRFAYVDGGIYLVAWVVDYGELRNFAAERIQTFAVTDELFEPRPLSPEPFAHSLGVNSGAPEEIVIEFEPGAASFVREREWHRSQRIEERADGGLTLTLERLQRLVAARVGAGIRSRGARRLTRCAGARHLRDGHRDSAAVPEDAVETRGARDESWIAAPQ